MLLCVGFDFFRLVGFTMGNARTVNVGHARVASAYSINCLLRNFLISVRLGVLVLSAGEYLRQVEHGPVLARASDVSPSSRDFNGLNDDGQDSITSIINSINRGSGRLQLHLAILCTISYDNGSRARNNAILGCTVLRAICRVSGHNVISYRQALNRALTDGRRGASVIIEAIKCRLSYRVLDHVRAIKLRINNRRDSKGVR